MSDELLHWKRKVQMEKKSDGKRKSVASIPANYVSILQLRERWMKEKERKPKETHFGVKQQQERRREEEAKVSAVVSKKKENDGEYSRETKKKWSKKTNQCCSVKEVVMSVSKAYIPREIPGVKTVQSRENATASNSIAVETQFHHLQIKKSVEEDGRDREVKRQGYYRNQKHETRTTVWVKKGENNGASGGNGVNF